jgi:hypothetical protein
VEDWSGRWKIEFRLETGFRLLADQKVGYVLEGGGFIQILTYFEQLEILIQEINNPDETFFSGF